MRANLAGWRPTEALRCLRHVALHAAEDDAMEGENQPPVEMSGDTSWVKQCPLEEDGAIAIAIAIAVAVAVIGVTDAQLEPGESWEPHLCSQAQEPTLINLFHPPPVE